VADDRSTRLTGNREIDALVERYELEPHPEGGYHRRIWTHPEAREGRTFGSAIVYLLTGGTPSKRHRIDAVELWHFNAGDPLELTIEDDTAPTRRTIGAAPDHDPVAIVPADAWQSAQSTGAWSFVSITVVPGFEWRGFEMRDGG
jgi:uncharacterized protein